MKTLERIHHLVLKQYGRFILPEGRIDLEKPVLVPVNMGIGDTVFLMPMLHALSLNTQLVIACPKKDVNEILSINIPKAILIDQITGKKNYYGTVICNFLSKWTPIIHKLLSLRIPTRIGHINSRDEKYAWFFNHHVKYEKWQHYTEWNNALLQPLHIEPIVEFTLRSAPINVPAYDILISPCSSFDPKKEWPYYEGLIRQLGDFKVGIIGNLKERPGCYFDNTENLAGQFSLLQTYQMLKHAKLVIGNCGGMVKIADMLGTKCIQIFREFDDSFPQAKISGINLIEPDIHGVQSAVIQQLSKEEIS